MRRDKAFIRGKIIALLLVLWVYMPAVRLPFYSDDILYFRRMTEVSIQDVLTSPDVSAVYYRPVLNILLLVPTTHLDLTPSAASWRMVVFWSHLINTALVGAFARQLRLNRTTQIIAMLIFGLFPFSFQAVTWLAAWFHALVTGAILIACIAGLRFLQYPRRIHLLVIAWAAGSIAPFIHENGVYVAALIPILWLLSTPLERIRLSWRRLILLIAPMGLAAFAYWDIRARLLPFQPQPDVILSNLRHNVVYLAQVLSFPVQFLTAFFEPVSPLVQVWFGFVAVMVIAAIVAWSLRDGHRRRLLAASAIWSLLVSAPAVAILEPGYLDLSPRIMYITSVGIAIGYGICFDWGLRQRGLIVFVAALALAGTLVLSAYNLRHDRMSRYLLLGDAYNDFNQQVESASRDTLVINAPAWIDTERQPFPLGRTSVFMFPPYIGLPDFVWLNNGMDREYDNLHPVVFQPVLQDWPGWNRGFIGPFIDQDTLYEQIQAHDRVYLFKLIDGNRYMPQLVGIRMEQSDRFVADFDQRVRLESVSVDRYQESFIRVGLRWRKLDDSPVPQVAFVHLICGEQIVDQLDAAPLGELYPFSAWQMGETWLDYRYLRPHDSRDSCLALRIGLYRRDDGSRAVITDEAGNPLDVEWLTVPIE